ncbi:hypothetical protein BBJ28_00026633 [Nothophytophthora sp. Chile5]|nr:hypothetical protein BBJ28_00026633 [Nothophytophthora sp. Chile5]
MLALFGRKAFMKTTKAFTPVLKPRADQHDFGVPFQLNSTSALFQEGDPVNMKSTLKKCKEENVSFTGALVATVVAAYYHASKMQGNPEPEGNFKLSTELNYNMRQRVAHPAEETQVGLYVTIAGCPFLGAEGVDMKTTKFWDLARRAREEIVKHAKKPVLMGMPLFMMDRKLHMKAAGQFLGDYKVKNSVSGDVNISSVGRYKQEHALANNRVLTVENMHIFAAVPHIGTSVTLWASSMNAFNYSIGHKCDHEVGEALFEAYVAVCENASLIGANDTMLDVLKRLDLYVPSY